MVDQYGNYFCQKIFKLLTPEERVIFIKKMKDSIEYIGTDPLGTHALQNLISGVCTNEEKNLMIHTIEESLPGLINDKIGVHIIERLIICYDETLLENIYSMILNNFVFYANDANTLCIVYFFITL